MRSFTSFPPTRLPCPPLRARFPPTHRAPPSLPSPPPFLAPAADHSPYRVPLLILFNIVVSVLLVSTNKVLFNILGFPFVTLLSSFHFFFGSAFFTVASQPRFGLFKAGEIPASNAQRLWALAAAGAFSIVMNNYSLRLNSLGTAQIFKAAVLPAVMGISFLTGAVDQQPTRRETLAAGLVVLGSCLSISADVTTTLAGVAVGLIAVLTTAQYQLWSGSFQKLMGLNGTQLLHASSLPQGVITFAAAMMVETHWQRALGGEAAGAHDLWTFRYTPMQLGVALATCVLAVALNWSVFSILGATSAVAMQVTTQAKTVLLILFDFMFFPRGKMAPGAAALFFLGSATCIGGALWYATVKAELMKQAAERAAKPAEGASGGTTQLQPSPKADGTVVERANGGGDK